MYSTLKLLNKVKQQHFLSSSWTVSAKLFARCLSGIFSKPNIYKLEAVANLSRHYCNLEILKWNCFELLKFQIKALVKSDLVLSQKYS